MIINKFILGREHTHRRSTTNVWGFGQQESKRNLELLCGRWRPRRIYLRDEIVLVIGNRFSELKSYKRYNMIQQSLYCTGNMEIIFDFEKSHFSDVVEQESDRVC